MDVLGLLRFLSCWRMDVLGLLRMASRKLLRSTYCLHVYWYLRHRPCASWSRTRLWKTRQPNKVCDFTLCPARRSAETFTRLSLLGAILKCTTTPNLFLRCHRHRASVELDKNLIITAKQPGGGFSNDLRETLTYGELLKHEFYTILRNYG